MIGSRVFPARRWTMVASMVTATLAGLTCRGPGATRSAADAAATPAAASPFAAATTTPASTAAARTRHPLPRIDVHMHIAPDGIGPALKMMDEWGIDGGVNLSGMYPGPPYGALEMQLAAAARTSGRIVVFANTNFRLVRTRKDYGVAMAELLAESKRLGAVGLKIPKGLGLGYPAPDGKHLLPIDDHGLDPLFEKAGELGMPVAIHIGDPKAFWKPATPENERWDELRAHPEWSFYGEPVPSWEALYAAFERRVARHPKTNFIAVHFGNDPEDPDRVMKMLDRYPNFYIDTAARIPELGRHPVEKMRRFYEKYQDRVLFGTDTGVGATPQEMMFGSTGETPPGRADEVRFFTSTWRYFETLDRQFESPTPIQGRWKIDGVGLSPAILRKIYFDNAARLLRWQPPVSVDSAAP
ncbi:MAG TPA: amidohydrolase family protein [Polyangia bacterium]|nr:amidohydrolase family protein [Polyangia bacterium]